VKKIAFYNNVLTKHKTWKRTQIQLLKNKHHYFAKFFVIPYVLVKNLINILKMAEIPRLLKLNHKSIYQLFCLYGKM